MASTIWILVLAAALTSTPPASASASRTLTGTVTDAETGNPLANICVSASIVVDGEQPRTVTDQKGNYELDSLPTDVGFEILYSDCNFIVYPDGGYVGQEAFLDVGTSSEIIDIELPIGGVIEGSITDEATGGDPNTSYVCVTVYTDPIDSKSNVGPQNIVDGTFGWDYILPPMPAGTYYVEFASLCKGGDGPFYPVEWYFNQTDPLDANPVVVTTGAATSEIHAPLGEPGSSCTLEASAGLDRTTKSGEVVHFDGSETTCPDLTRTFDWDFGDGTSDAGVFASHRFSRPGTYTVTLTVSSDGQVDTDVLDVHVDPLVITAEVDEPDLLLPIRHRATVEATYYWAGDFAGTSEFVITRLDYSAENIPYSFVAIVPAGRLFDPPGIIPCLWTRSLKTALFVGDSGGGPLNLSVTGRELLVLRSFIPGSEFGEHPGVPTPGWACASASFAAG